MLLWSIMPQEVVWEGFDSPPTYQEISRNGRFYLLDKNGKIARLISTDPADYLSQ